MRSVPALWTSPGQAIAYITIILCAIGTVNIFSASFVTASKEWQDSYFYLKRHAFTMVIGFVALWVAASLDYHRSKWIVPLALGATLATLSMVPFIGIEANGARRWLNLGISFQPSELAKLAAVMSSAVYLGWQMDKGKNITFLSWPFLATGLMAGLIYIQPDMGTAVVVVALCMGVYILAGAPFKQWASMIAGGVVLAGLMVLAAPYRKHRVESWLNPWNYEQDSGYQAVQSLLAIGSGGLTGTGLGKGASKFFYLPEAHTDFAFAVLSQEWGYMGALAVLGLFLLIGWYGLQIALKAPDNYGVLLAGGVTFLIVGQAVGNMAMVCGLLPVTGVPLPFISFGGTALVVNLAATGVLISVGRNRTNNPPLSEPEPLAEGLADRRKERQRLRLVRKV